VELGCVFIGAKVPEEMFFERIQSSRLGLRRGLCVRWRHHCTLLEPRGEMGSQSDAGTDASAA